MIVAEGEKHAGGRPSLYDPAYCAIVIELGKEGKSLAQMAAHFDVARSTIDQWAKDHREFSDALSRARTHMQAKLEEMGFAGMANREFNAPVWKTTMQARFRDDYTDRQEISGPQGGPIEMSGATAQRRRAAAALLLARKDME